MLSSLSRVATFASLSFLVTPFALASAAQTDLGGDLSPEDRASVRSAHETARHLVVETDDGLVARNPGQGWRLGFDGRGFSVQPDANGWTWGLELVSYGFVGNENTVGELACVEAEGGRVAYTWDDTIEEWYVNDQLGFEHGFTVHERPDGEGLLTLALRVRGSLKPAVQDNRLDVHFVDEHGASALTYSGLTVFDADGRDLRAWFEVSSTGLLLSIDEQDAHYPLTIDPIAQQGFLKASNTGAYDRFGNAVAVSGDTLVIGAPIEGSNATGVNGDQLNNSADISGAAYVFIREGTNWSQQAYLKASNTEGSDFFGWSVSIFGDTLVVGAISEGSAATGINGNETSNGAPNSGAAYVFVRNGTTWSQQAYLKASNTETFDGFGGAVAIEGNTLVVGAIYEAGAATGVNGDESSNTLFSAGAGYVFVRSGATWTQQAYLKASNPGISDHFGSAVSISENTLVVGARDEDSSATSINGDQTSDAALSAGAAYVFVRSGTTWSQQSYLKASNMRAGDSFGISLSVSADTVVVGACEEDGASSGVNGTVVANNRPSSGAAYAFVRVGTAWTQQAYFKASMPNSGDRFGWSVAVDGDQLVVGARDETSTATGINGGQAYGGASQAGAAYTFVRSGSTWVQGNYLKGSNTSAGHWFGYSVALSRRTVLVGAPTENSGATGVDGNPNSGNIIGSGAAYVFALDGVYLSFCSGDGGNQLGCTGCPCGNNTLVGTVGGCINSAGTSSRLEASGDASVSLPPMSTGDLRFGLSGAPANVFCILNSGDGLAPGNPANSCFGLGTGLLSASYDGLRCAVMNTRRHGGRPANASGEVGVTTNSWGGEAGPQAGLAVAGSGFVVGQTRYFQVIYRENPLAVCGRGLNTSQAVEVVFEP